MEETIATILIMRQQEDTGYLTAEFFQQICSEQNWDNVNTPAACHKAMATWCYDVVDYCNLHRETVEIAMSILDRFLVTSEAGDLRARTDLRAFQLAAMTALYTAVKIHEPKAMDPKLISNLSRRMYTTYEIERLESEILGAVGWRVNPPTSLTFVRLFMELIPRSILPEGDIRDLVVDLTRPQSEMAVGNYVMSYTKASTVGYCALVNALALVGMKAQNLESISRTLSNLIGIDDSDDIIQSVQNDLFWAIGNEVTDETSRQMKGALAANEARTRYSKLMSARRCSMEESPRTTRAWS